MIFSGLNLLWLVLLCLVAITATAYLVAVITFKFFKRDTDVHSWLRPPLLQGVVAPVLAMLFATLGVWYLVANAVATSEANKDLTSQSYRVTEISVNLGGDNGTASIVTPDGEKNVVIRKSSGPQGRWATFVVCQLAPDGSIISASCTA